MLLLAQDITTTNGGTSGVNAVTLPEFTFGDVQWESFTHTEFFHLLLLEAGGGWGGGSVLVGIR